MSGLMEQNDTNKNETSGKTNNEGENVYTTERD
jgi:hypothetical protein